WTTVFELNEGIQRFLDSLKDDKPLGWAIGSLEGAFIVAQNSDPSEQVIPNLISKYGTDAQNVLFTLKPQSEDTTYKDQTIVETVRLLVDSTVNLPVFSSDPSPNGKNAVAGLAKLVQAECSLP